MNVQEFERILKLGLGRAILHLQTHDATPYRDVILHACLHNISLNPQLEGTKANYIARIIDLTGDLAFYRKQILDAPNQIDHKTDHHDLGHILELVAVFAYSGDKEARQALYDIFNGSLLTEHVWGAELIVEVDKLKGFIYIAKKLGEKSIADPDYEVSTHPKSILEDEIGKAACEKELLKARSQNEMVEAYLTRMENQLTARQSRPRFPLKGKPYSEIKQLIENNSEKSMYGLGVWGKFASHENLYEAAVDLLAMMNNVPPQQIVNHLKIFHVAPFPLDPRQLFPLIQHRHPQIRASALTVLEQITHPSLREVALDHIQRHIYSGEVVGLLNRNFENGDWTLIEEITQRQLNEEEYHRLQINTHDIFDNHPDPIAAGTLLNLYENSRCSFCRQYTVKYIHSINALPDHIREECLHDSNRHVRELAKNNFVWLEE